MNHRIALFAKVPKLGAVKTRLASVIGPEAALDCYLQLLERAIEATACFETEVWFDGEVGSEWTERSLTLKQQHGGDLGERMHAAFVDGVALLVGSDIPLISTRYIERAMGLLDSSDVVLGPTEDGGYCLIGMKCPAEELFAGVEWGTSKVFEQTMDASRRIGAKVAVLPKLWDVDEYSDYQRWLAMRTSPQLPLESAF